MIYVCSDIHGHLTRYKKLIKKIHPSDTLYILGDVIDRNPDGIEIIKDIMTRDNVTLLCGNHENFMFNYLSRQRLISADNNKTDHIFENPSQIASSIWFAENNDGQVTYDAFLRESEETQIKIFEYISNLPLIALLELNGTKYHLSHAGTFSHNFNQYDLTKQPTFLGRQDMNPYYVLWCCPYKYSDYLSPNSYPTDFTCIMGHVPVQIIRNQYCNYRPYVDNNLITIDGGCAFSSVEESTPDKVKTALTCICLDTMKNIYIH